MSKPKFTKFEEKLNDGYVVLQGKTLGQHAFQNYPLVTANINKNSFKDISPVTKPRNLSGTVSNSDFSNINIITEEG